MRHFRFLFQHWRLILIAVFTGIGASLLEGLGISLIFPILQDLQTTNQTPPFPFSLISDWFLKYESAKLPSFVRIYIIAAI